MRDEFRNELKTFHDMFVRLAATHAKHLAELSKQQDIIQTTLSDGNGTATQHPIMSSPPLSTVECTLNQPPDHRMQYADIDDLVSYVSDKSAKFDTSDPTLEPTGVEPSTYNKVDPFSGLHMASQLPNDASCFSPPPMNFAAIPPSGGQFTHPSNPPVNFTTIPPSGGQLPHPSSPPVNSIVIPPSGGQLLHPSSLPINDAAIQLSSGLTPTGDCYSILSHKSSEVSLFDTSLPHSQINIGADNLDHNDELVSVDQICKIL